MPFWKWPLSTRRGPEGARSGSSPSLPQTPKDLIRLFPGSTVFLDGVIAVLALLGAWRYPMRAYGDLERMRFIDKVYWLYKTARPIRKARRHSDLERFFDEQKRVVWALPPDFETKSELSVSAVGDLINHAYLASSSESLYAEVSDLVFGADVSMANLECPVVPGARKEFVIGLRAPPPLYHDLRDFAVAKGIEGRKFTFMATACNHSLDFGVEGVESTIRVLEREGIAFNGLNGDEQQALRAAVIERRGIRLGVVAYTFGLNAHRPSADRPNLVSTMKLNDGVGANDFARIGAQLDWCAGAGVDFVIAHLHWGLENEFYPTPEQVELAHHLAELGVDAVIGHHPHVLQPVESYRTRRDPLRVVPIYYSLGNLISYFSAPYMCRSGVARLELVKGRLPDGKERVYVRNASLVEVVQLVDEEKKRIRLRRA